MFYLRALIKAVTFIFNKPIYKTGSFLPILSLLTYGVIIDIYGKKLPGREI